MALVHPDFGRRIDLPGAGPCPRPIDIDQARSGFSSLVSLRAYSFAAGKVIDGEAEADEVFVVLMRGQADIAVSCAGRSDTVSLQRDGGMRVVYMPPHAAYRLTAVTDCDIAYARVAAAGGIFPQARGFAGLAERLDVAGYALRMDLALTTVRSGAPIWLRQDGGSPERFVHIRSGDASQVSMAGAKLGDWDTVTLDEGEEAALLVDAGTAEVLIISASRGQVGIAKVAMNA